eukprot:366370-Chlamydomonas_euryale.AAC.8
MTRHSRADADAAANTCQCGATCNTAATPLQHPCNAAAAQISSTAAILARRVVQPPAAVAPTAAKPPRPAVAPASSQSVARAPAAPTPSSAPRELAALTCPSARRSTEAARTMRTMASPPSSFAPAATDRGEGGWWGM